MGCPTIALWTLLLNLGFIGAPQSRHQTGLRLIHGLLVNCQIAASIAGPPDWENASTTLGDNRCRIDLCRLVLKAEIGR